MKNSKWLAVLLIAALLLTPVAMMEEAPAGEPVAAETETPTEDVPDDVPEDVPENTEDVPEVAVIPEAVDAVVTEASDIALDGVIEDAEPVEASDEAESEQGDAPTFEAQVVEESLDDIAEYEAAEEASEPEGAAAMAEEIANESAKLMEAGSGIPIDEAHFPDAGFRAFIAREYDWDSNGVLYDDERLGISIMALCRIDNAAGLDEPPLTPLCNAQSLQGIEYFPDLTNLDCSGIGVTSLDLSKNNKLEFLECRNNSLSTLTLGNQPKLVWLVCSHNQLTSLDIKGCPNIYWLQAYDNKMGTILIVSNSAFRRINKGSYFIIKNGSIKFTTKKKNPGAYRWCKPKSASVRGDLFIDQKVKISGTDASFTPVPGVEQIACTGKRAKAAVNAGSTFQINPGATAGKKFKSSKKKVATVDSNGIVTAKAKGKTKITFKVGKKKRTLTLTVNDPTIPQSVTFSAPTTAVKKGDTVTLTPAVPEGTDAGGFKWKSSNKKVATVKNGVVTFKKKGKVTITCTAVRGKKKAKIRFKVGK